MSFKSPYSHKRVLTPFQPQPVDSVNLLIFGAAESAVTIIAVSIPILRALLYISSTPPKPRFYNQPGWEERPSDDGNHSPARDFGREDPPPTAAVRASVGIVGRGRFQ